MTLLYGYTHYAPYSTFHFLSQLKEIQDARRLQREKEFQGSLEEETSRMVLTLIKEQRDAMEKMEMEFVGKEQDIRKRELRS